jgi:glycosyltransferase involved in cell wall biosynthesis
MACTFCIVIPVYNHRDALAGTFQDAASTGLPCIAVNDGSTDGSLEELHRLEKIYPNTEVLSYENNRGKGEAVLLGFRRAVERGFSHAITVDADGQHNLSAVTEALELSKQNPGAAIIGRPLFDSNAPIERLIGREISNFFTWLAMLSTEARDGLCGFRVYPLHRCAEMLFKRCKCRRMEFDPEVLVLMGWAGIPMINVPIAVSYPTDGVSHFRYLHDNVLIIGRFIQLVLGMIPRSPILLARKIGRMLGWHRPHLIEADGRTESV